MTFLPIVERELRVAARKRFTFWSRLMAAALALVIFGLLQLLLQTSGGFASAGQVEFAVLKWLAFAFAAGAGLFLTSDSLSEEIREGTLGLLFLTDLRGYDVVFGKLLTQSLRAFYGLLAAFPIMGLALLAGGVTGSEFWLSLLAICNTLFLSLSLGMFVSSISRDATRAMSGTLLFGILILVILPVVDLAMDGFDTTKHRAIFSLADPAYLFAGIGAFRTRDFWTCLLIQNALAWAFLFLASLRAPRAWQEKSAAATASRPGLANRWRFGGPRFRLKLRRRLFAVNPLLWLALRDRWLPRMIWTLTVIVFFLQSASLVIQFRDIHAYYPSGLSVSSAPTNSTASGGTVVYSSGKMNSSGGYTATSVSYGVSRNPAHMAFTSMATTLAGLFRIGLVLWVASQAARFFVDATRNGALELLLVAPVNAAQIIRAQWLGLCRTYWFPALCIALLHLGEGFVSARETQVQMAAAAAASVRGGVAPLPVGVYMAAYICKSVMSALTVVADLAAVAWFGMWMGLTSRKTSVAVMKTVCFVLVLPWIAFMFVFLFTMFGLGATGLMRIPGAAILVPSLVYGILALCKDELFIWLARRNLKFHFREELTRDRSFSAGPPINVPRPLPPPIPAT